MYFALIRYISYIYLSLGVFICLIGGVCAWVIPSESMMIPLVISLIAVMLIIIFIGIIKNIYCGKTKTDGSHLGPFFWISIGVFAIISPIIGIFTGHYQHIGFIAYIQAVIYVAAGILMLVRGNILLKNRLTSR